MIHASQAHEDRNLANKKTPAERREKKIEKLVGAATEGEATPVSVYRVNRLESKQHRFKVRINAEVRSTLLSKSRQTQDCNGQCKQRKHLKQ